MSVTNIKFSPRPTGANVTTLYPLVTLNFPDSKKEEQKANAPSYMSDICSFLLHRQTLICKLIIWFIKISVTPRG